MSSDAIRIGTAYAEALAAKDYDALAELLADDVDFRALTPNKQWEQHTPKEAIHDVICVWFDDGDHIEELRAVQVRPVAGPRSLVSYQLLVRNADGPHVVEQQAYFEHDADKITWMRTLCAGYIPV
jgi:ketosteroid isomerase-like protein